MNELLPTASEVLDARHVIGLDIGDGESALVWSSTGTVPRATVYRRQRTAESNILTALSWQADRCLFGEEAVLTEGAVQFTVNFKGHGQKALVGQFGEALLNEFFEANPEVKENCLIFVGHPAGWPPSVVAEYSECLRGLGPSVYLLAESQSALVHVRDRGSGMGKALGNALVIDIGSSSVDFTVVENMIPRNIDIGADLGCSQIDRELAAMAKTALRPNKEFSSALESSGGDGLLLLACRRAKEAQFSGRIPSLLDNRLSHNPDHAAIADLGFGWLKAQEIPSLIMRPKGWAHKFERIVSEAKKQLLNSPETVVLTGGGSRMPFTSDVCQRAFPEAVVERDSDPSLSVARGLASAGRQRVRVARFRRDVKGIATSDETRAYIRAQTEEAFHATKASIASEMRKKNPNAWPGLIANPPKGEEVALGFQNSIDAYLTPRAQEICAEYSIDDQRLGVNWTLPPLFAQRIVKTISRAASSSQWGGNIAGGVARTARDAVVRKNLTTLGRASIYAFVLTVAVDAAWSRHERQRAIKNVLAAELSVETAQSLIDEVLATLTDLMDDRVSDIERFVT